MTKKEIKAKITATLAGQGSAVDIGGQLPAILDAIIDSIPDAPEPVQPLEVFVLFATPLDPDLQDQTYLLAPDADYEDVIAAIRSGRPVSFVYDGIPQQRYAYAGESKVTVGGETIPVIGVTIPYSFDFEGFKVDSYPVFFREI